MIFLIGLAVLAVIAYRASTPEERTRALRAVVQGIRKLMDYGRRELAPFDEALRARTPHALVAPALVAVNVIVFLGLIFGTGSRSDPATIVAWGASVGPRTSNGEWWRLVTELFVQPSFVVLLVHVAVIVQVGFLLERVVGPFPLATTYVAAGMLSSVAGLAWYPMRVTAGASGALFGLYGLLFAVIVMCEWREAELMIPLTALKRMVPASVAFGLSTLVSGADPGGGANAIGLVTGLALGFALAREVGHTKPAWRPTAIAFAIALVAAVGSAIPLRGIVDVRPELRRLVAIEHQTAEQYETAAAQFRKGKKTVWQLAELIERSIIPALQAEEARIGGLHGVPREDEPLVADAREYLQLRSQSWQLRAKGLRDEGVPVDPAAIPRGSNMTFRDWAQARHQTTLRTLGNAEGAERASLQALSRLPQ